VGDNYCLVLTTSTTQITCRIVEIENPKAETVPVYVYLKTSEEVTKCGPNDDCLFVYVTPSATATGITAAFDAVSQTT